MLKLAAQLAVVAQRQHAASGMRAARPVQALCTPSRRLEHSYATNKADWRQTLEDIVQHPHPSSAASVAKQALEKQSAAVAQGQATYFLAQPVYDDAYLHRVAPRHKPPERLSQRVGYAAVQLARRVFDVATGYGPNMTEARWMRRFVFLETVAGVPGMVAGMLRHMRSLRALRRDHGWIRTLLEEAENERMHLLTFLSLRQPGPLFRTAVLVSQGMFFNAYFLLYLASPRTAHAVVGYLEEEAVKTYSHALRDMEAGPLQQWAQTSAPEVATKYWQLRPGATMREVVLAIRADEAAHAFVNHTFADLPQSAKNPFSMGGHHVPEFMQ